MKFKEQPRPCWATDARYWQRQTSLLLNGYWLFSTLRQDDQTTHPTDVSEVLVSLEIFDPEDGGTEQDGLPITFWTYIREMFGLNLYLDTGYPEVLVVLLSPSNKMQG
jgi:hypothetical protein